MIVFIFDSLGIYSATVSLLQLKLPRFPARQLLQKLFTDVIQNKPQLIILTLFLLQFDFFLSLKNHVNQLDPIFLILQVLDRNYQLLLDLFTHFIIDSHK